MTKTFFIFLLLTLILPARGEYSGYHMRISITDTKDRTTAGYVYVTEHRLNLDSLGNTAYLKRALTQNYNGVDTFIFFRHRITYRYVPSWAEGEKSKKEDIYYLLDPVHLPFNTIRKIEVRKMIQFSYLSGMEGDFTLRDTTWMKNAPVKQANFGGYLCSYQVFVHQSSKKVENVLRELETKQAEFERREKEDPDLYDNYDYEDEKEEVMSGLIRKLLKNEKIVVVTFCTC